MKRKLALLLILCMALGLMGCGSKNKNNEGTYTLYYINGAGTRLVTAPYTPIASMDANIVRELFDKLKEAGPDDSLATIPQEITFDSCEFNGDVLNLYLNGSFDKMSQPGFLLSLSAMVRTLTQLESVAGVSVYVNGDALHDRGGRTFRVLKASSFVNTSPDNPDEYRQVDVVLYFANEAGDRLVKTVRPVTCGNNIAIERVVVEQLIAGPEDPNIQPTLPKTVQLLGVNVRDGICYVNFDTKYNADAISSYDTIAAYSVVNSLAELPGIEQVQISINGSSDVTSSTGQLNFAVPMMPNPDLVG